MRSAYDSMAFIRACAQELNPEAMRAAIYEYVRGGLPSRSMSDGRGNSGETPAPALEGHDAALLGILDAYEQALDDLASKALKIRRTQREAIYRLPQSLNPIPQSIVLAALGQEPNPAHDRLPWCTSCLRVKGHLCPVADERHGGKDGTLCRWCIDHRDGAKWPPLEHVKAHAEGRRVRVTVKR